MSIDFQQQLNPSQYQAVTYDQGPLLILAGAGSGKTRALTYRAAFLIEQLALDPSSILLLTFTNKAAQEMQHRLSQLTNASLPFAGTFHSFCAKILRIEGKHLGLSPRFLIYDDADQLDLIKAVINQLDISSKDFKPRAFLSQIGKAKNELLTPSQYEQIATGYFQETLARVYHRYQDLLHQNNALDFDDLLLHTLRLLTRVDSVTKKYQQHFKHILIDEYQDTNKAQYLIAKTLANQHQQLTVVGDASQSIYRWRGADYRNLEYLQRDFPTITTIKLEQNYRSTQPILNAAHSVIRRNKSHPVLELWTDNTQGELPLLFQARDENHEADFVINTYRNNPGRSTAILYRTNAQSRVFEEVCLRLGIPYVLIGGVKFYQRKEVKDILSYLRLLVNPNDTVSLSRTQKLGKRRLQTFLQKISDLDTNTSTSSEIFDQVLMFTNYTDRLDPKDEADIARLENIKELRAVTTQFDRLDDFLENVALVENQTEVTSKSPNLHHQKPLTLMTIHSAKGLEFDQVFVVGLEEGLFPHSRSLFEPEELEEERRLCYVALTRARNHLTLSYAQNRTYYGGTLNGTISRFIQEIPQEYLDTVNKGQSYQPHKSSRPTISDDILEGFLNDEIDIDRLLE